MKNSLPLATVTTGVLFTTGPLKYHWYNTDSTRLLEHVEGVGNTLATRACDISRNHEHCRSSRMTKRGTPRVVNISGITIAIIYHDMWLEVLLSGSKTCADLLYIFINLIVQVFFFFESIRLSPEGSLRL